MDRRRLNEWPAGNPRNQAKARVSIRLHPARRSRSRCWRGVRRLSGRRDSRREEKGRAVRLGESVLGERVPGGWNNGRRSWGGGILDHVVNALSANADRKRSGETRNSMT
jgi:hypothetical protein